MGGLFFSVYRVVENSCVSWEGPGENPARITVTPYTKSCRECEREEVIFYEQKAAYEKSLEFRRGLLRSALRV